MTTTTTQHHHQAYMHIDNSSKQSTETLNDHWAKGIQGGSLACTGC